MIKNTAFDLEQNVFAQNRKRLHDILPRQRTRLNKPHAIFLA